jgi:DNA-binding LacI/PurR family transcriptional regulator
VAKNRVTIRDVAAHAGVSHQTVSRVINDSDQVLPETRERVIAAIQELDYHPSALARSMARGRSHIVACLAPNLTDFTFASIINGAETEARKQDYFWLSSSVPDLSSFVELVTDLVTSRRVEGMVVINPYADERHTKLPQGFPVVLVGARPREGAYSSVALDDAAVGYEATRHLLELGHDNIAMITGPIREDATQDRYQGYERALSAAGIEPAPDRIIEGDWSAQSGHDALMQLATADNLPSAIFSQNDLMAAGVLRAARDLGLDLPNDLSVIGVDDIPLAEFLEPPLTTLRQDFQLIGREAAQLLIQNIDQPDSSSRQLRLPAELIVRRSTAVFNSDN